MSHSMPLAWAGNASSAYALPSDLTAFRQDSLDRFNVRIRLSSFVPRRVPRGAATHAMALLLSSLNTWSHRKE